MAAAAAAGIIAAVILYVDIPYRMQDGKNTEVVAAMVCLPHKQTLFGGPQTDECAFGFRGEDGNHFALYNYGEVEEENPGLSERVGTGQKFQISGVFHYGGSAGYEKYDIKGMIDADLFEPILN